VPELYELKESLQYHIAITEKIRKVGYCFCWLLLVMLAMLSCWVRLE
jgi:hypothetical protein